ncbi:hypothetical protein [Nocardiopsis sp. MG754419]|uniref:hypothetical protein n=1 Tax=Nocardiopsis sp. MG754419 TaxID=2259865 RepID=UPI001BA79080|nr:hypothetical protein [Nocardiopsis sp. MG754419]MBR8743381.1 hypothetical protein [Nocardiopsis sp. MG754419]
MPEHILPTVRLKSAVRARSLAEEGVALSMGATAVVVRGGQADTVWRALEPTLRAGFERDALLGRFPERGRPFLAGILDQLEEHGFLRDLEPEPTEPSPVARAAYPHLESLTRRPYAALAALEASTVRVRSSCPLLATEVRRALERSGFGAVDVDPAPDRGRPATVDTGPRTPGTEGSVEGDPILLTTWLEVPDAAPVEHLVATGGGLWLAGPRDRASTPDLAARLRTWFSTLAEGHGGPDEAGLRLTRTLVAAQLVLSLVAHVARTVEGTAPATDPAFIVTTDELVSEPHTLPLADALDPIGDAPPPAPGSEDPPEIPAQLDGVTPLWDRVFGPVDEPRPGALPQLPVGLALSGDVAGCGLTTAEARRDALLGALHRVVWRPFDAPVGRGLGLTAVGAVGAAVGDLLLSLPDRRWWDIDPPDPSPVARRLWACLNLRFGVPADLSVQALDGAGPYRVRVLLREAPDTPAPVTDADAAGAADAHAPYGLVNVGDEPLGTAVAADVDAGVEEALLRAVASVRLTDASPGTTPTTAVTGTDATTASLARWASVTGAVRPSAPAGADHWRRLGVHAAVATWT